MTELERKAREAADEMAYATFTGEPNQTGANRWRADIIARHFQDWQPNARLREAAQNTLERLELCYATTLRADPNAFRAKELREALAPAPEPIVDTDGIRYGPCSKKQDVTAFFQKALVSERERLLLEVLEAARLYIEVDGPDRTWQERASNHASMGLAIRAFDECESAKMSEPESIRCACAVPMTPEHLRVCDGWICVCGNTCQMQNSGFHASDDVTNDKTTWTCVKCRQVFDAFGQPLPEAHG